MMKKQVNILIIISLFTFAGCFSGVNNYFSSITAEEILERVKAPEFNNVTYKITDFGAIGDNNTDCTSAINNAIEKCSKDGGGIVVVEKGVYLTGAIHFRNNVNLHLDEGSVLKFYTDPKRYLPLVFNRWEGVECMNYSGLIYGYGLENIAITGKGLIDGNASINDWWTWKGIKDYAWKEGMPNQKAGRDSLFSMAQRNVPVEQRVMGEGFYLRPNMIQFYKSKNILIEGVTLKNSPMWFMNPVLCENVTIDGVTIEGLGPNNDGCDPESCKDVVIKNCYFNTGDDCIAIKSGRNNDGRRVNVPSENIVIKDCVMKEGHGGVVMGSEISGGVRNVFVENCKMSSPNLDRAIRFKTNSLRGGLMENIYVKNIEVGEVKEAVLKVDFYYEEGDAGDFAPIVRNIILENVISKKSGCALILKGYERSKISNIILKDCVFENAAGESIIKNCENIIYNNVTINNQPVK